MIFLSAVISLLMERFFHWNQVRQWQWFLGYQSWMGSKISHLNPALILAMTVLPFVFVTGIVGLFLSNCWHGIGYLIFSTIILFYCLGPQNLWAQAYQCLNELNKEDPREALESVQKAFGIALPENSQAFHQVFLRALFVAANQRIFAVICWFAVMGPMGAVLYRMIEICKSSSMPITVLATKVQTLLDWVPARIFAFLFALTGNFSKVFVLWKSIFKKELSSNEDVLSHCGMAALEISAANGVPENGSAEKEALLLFDRTFILALILLAILDLLV